MREEENQRGERRAGGGALVCDEHGGQDTEGRGLHVSNLRRRLDGNM